MAQGGRESADGHSRFGQLGARLCACQYPGVADRPLARCVIRAALGVDFGARSALTSVNTAMNMPWGAAGIMPREPIR